MAFNYGFYDSKNGDRTYKADSFNKVFSLLMKSGVYPNPATSLQVTAKEPAAMSLSLAPGFAVLEGKSFENTSAYNGLSLSTANGVYPRIDRVVVRASITNRSIAVVILEGTPSEYPVAPPIVRDGTLFDISLATVYAAAGATAVTQANITDTRGDNTVCGWVTGAVEQIDTTELFAQYDAQWQLLKGVCEQDAAAVIAAWNALNAVKSVSNIAPVDGNISLTQDNIPSGNTYKRINYQNGTATSSTNGVITVTFGTAFAAAPNVLATITHNPSQSTGYMIQVYNVTATGFSARVHYTQGGAYFGTQVNIPFNWLAIGV